MPPGEIEYALVSRGATVLAEFRCASPGSQLVSEADITVAQHSTSCKLLVPRRSGGVATQCEHVQNQRRTVSTVLAMYLLCSARVMQVLIGMLIAALWTRSPIWDACDAAWHMQHSHVH